jgi:protein sidekick
MHAKRVNRGCVLKRKKPKPLAPRRFLHELRTIWTKDDIPIEDARIAFNFKDSWNRTLILISANLTYTGVYACHVDLRSGGYPTISASASVEVLG